MINISKEVENEPFDPDEFVERLAGYTKPGGEHAKSNYDLDLLYETFTKAIEDLTVLQERQKKKCEQLEQECKEEEKTDLKQIGELQERNKLVLGLFHELDERINYVAAKVIHLGDQLESVNMPRSRAAEAFKLITYFEDFHNPGSSLDSIFTDKNKIEAAADIIQKLYSVALELPEDKFGPARQKISIKYDEIERSLIEEFDRAHRCSDVARMKEIANLLTHFKGYSQCIDTFIEYSQSSNVIGVDVFSNIIPLCERNYKLMGEVFTNPEEVMAKFVLNLFSLKLQNYVGVKLNDKSDPGKYLKTMHEIYLNTERVSGALAKYDMGNDETYLPKLTKLVFSKYLDNYVSIELKYMRDRCGSILQRFYHSKNHQKKQIQTGGFQDLRRDLQAVIGTRTNFNIVQIDDHGGETFISEEIANSILQDSRAAFQRCHVLSQASEVANNATALLEILLQHLLVEHVDYALELGLQAVPLPESKTFPQLYFFDIVRHASSIVNMLEKVYVDCVIPLVISTPKHADCTAKERYVLESIEIKVDSGLDRCVNAVVGWVKVYLQNEQKRSDFKPETEKKETLPSQACLTVVQNVSSVCTRIRRCLDPKNANSVLTELGIRFHRVILDHLFQYQFNTSEAVYAVCDVIEYKKCASEFKVPLVTTLFDTLHALWNLLLVRPENLKQVCTGETLSELDESVLLNFIQLRSDYKTQKLSNLLKGVPS